MLKTMPPPPTSLDSQSWTDQGLRTPQDCHVPIPIQDSNALDLAVTALLAVPMSLMLAVFLVGIGPGSTHTHTLLLPPPPFPSSLFHPHLGVPSHQPLASPCPQPFPIEQK